MPNIPIYYFQPTMPEPDVSGRINTGTRDREFGALQGVAQGIGQVGEAATQWGEAVQKVRDADETERLNRIALDYAADMKTFAGTLHNNTEYDKWAGKFDEQRKTFWERNTPKDFSPKGREKLAALQHRLDTTTRTDITELAVAKRAAVAAKQYEDNMTRRKELEIRGELPEGSVNNLILEGAGKFFPEDETARRIEDFTVEKARAKLQAATLRDPAAMELVLDGMNSPVSPVNSRGRYRANDNNYNYGKRPDGTNKGRGWLGAIPLPNGSVMTELSTTVEVDGKEILIPAIVPSLTAEEIQELRKVAMHNEGIPVHILEKAVAHAVERLKAGKSPFPENEKEFPPLSAAEKEAEEKRKSEDPGDEFARLEEERDKIRLMLEASPFIKEAKLSPADTQKALAFAQSVLHQRQAVFWEQINRFINDPRHPSEPPLDLVRQGFAYGFVKAADVARIRQQFPGFGRTPMTATEKAEARQRENAGYALLLNIKTDGTREEFAATYAAAAEASAFMKGANADTRKMLLKLASDKFQRADNDSPLGAIVGDIRAMANNGTLGASAAAPATPTNEEKVTLKSGKTVSATPASDGQRGTQRTQATQEAQETAWALTEFANEYVREAKAAGKKVTHTELGKAVMGKLTDIKAERASAQLRESLRSALGEGGEGLGGALMRGVRAANEQLKAARMTPSQKSEAAAKKQIEDAMGKAGASVIKRADALQAEDARWESYRRATGKTTEEVARVRGVLANVQRLIEMEASDGGGDGNGGGDGAGGGETSDDDDDENT